MKRIIMAALAAFLLVVALANPAEAKKRIYQPRLGPITEFCGDRYGPCQIAASTAPARTAKKRSAVRSVASPRKTAHEIAAVAAEPTFRIGQPSIALAAQQYVGMTPSVAELKAWARETGIGTWRWGQRVYCALGVNKVLADVGQRGSGSFKADSFKYWGSRTHDPQPGDIAVVGNHHVAIVVARSARGVVVVSFNDNGHRVLRREYPLRGVQYRTASL